MCACAYLSLTVELCSLARCFSVQLFTSIVSRFLAAFPLCYHQNVNSHNQRYCLLLLLFLFLFGWYVRVSYVSALASVFIRKSISLCFVCHLGERKHFWHIRMFCCANRNSVKLEWNLYHSPLSLSLVSVYIFKRSLSLYLA